MRRPWSVIKDPEISVPGDDEALSRAMALGHRFDAQTLESVHDALVELDRFGGQLFVAVRRAKYDADGNEIPRDRHGEVPGQFFTTGFIFAHETRDINVDPEKPKPVKPVGEKVELTDLDSKLEVGVGEPVEG